MSFFSRQQGPQIDIFIGTPEKGFVSLNEVIKTEKERLQEKININEQRIIVNKKLLRNYHYDMARTLLWSLCIFSALTIFMVKPYNDSFNKKLAIGTLGLGAVHTGAGVLLSKQKKKLEKQDDFLKQRERSFA